MKKTTLLLQDYTNCKFLDLDPITRKKFNAALKFMVPHARHTPQFKLKRWDGKVSFATLGGCTYINLLDMVLPIIINAGYDVEIDDQRIDYNFVFPEIDDEFIADRFWQPGHVMAGEPIMLRDYQVDTINNFFQNQQSIQCVSTGAGKTIITACLSLAIEDYGRSIVIVPSKDLVRQTEKDYRNVGLDVGVFYGDRKEWGHKHTICTWQSLAVFDKNTKSGTAEIAIDEFLEDVVCVIIDEVHGAKAQVLRDLLCGPMAHIPLRWGLTGTIPKEEYEFMGLLSSIGPVVGEIKASNLQEKGVLASCDIEFIQLDESHVEFNDWDSENKFITTDPERLEYIAKFCDDVSKSGNTLILVDRRETGFILEKLIPNSVFVYGDTKSADREEEYDLVRTASDKVIIATYGVASTGINIPRLFNLVLTNCGKSFTRVIQSAGRLLRKANDKNHAKIYDFTSSLKFSRRQATKRKEYYKEAGYPFIVVKKKYR